MGTETKETTSTEVSILTPFGVKKAELQKLADDYKNMAVTKENFKQANEARLTLYRKRQEVQKVEKSNTDKLNALKEDNWAAAKILIDIIKPVEDDLQAKCKKIEDAEANRVKEIKRKIEDIHLKSVAIRAMGKVVDLDALAEKLKGEKDSFSEFNTDGNQAIADTLKIIENRKVILEDEEKAKEIKQANDAEEKAKIPETKEQPVSETLHPQFRGAAPPTGGGTYRAPEKAFDSPETEAFEKPSAESPWQNSSMELYTYQGHSFGISRDLPEDAKDNLKHCITEIVDNLPM